MSTTRLCLQDDLNECPCQGGTLDRLIQPAILLVLTEGPLHGSRLAKRIGAMPGLGAERPDVSGVYRSLKAMDRRGLVVSTWDFAEAGPAKKSYRITPAGRRCLRLWVKTLEEYRDGVVTLLEAARKAVEAR